MPAKNRNCCSVLRDNQIQEYLDGGLPPAQVQELQAHLTVCTACNASMAQARAADEALRQAALSLPVAGDLYAGFAEKLAASQPRRMGLRLTTGSWAGVSASLAMAACALAFWAHQAQVTRGSDSISLAINQPVPPAASQQSNIARLPLNSEALGYPMADRAKMPAASEPVHASNYASAGVRLRRLAAVTRRKREDLHVAISQRYSLKRLPAAAAVRALAANPAAARPDMLTGEVKPPVLDGQFAMVVQDDVRGFTAEVRGSAAAAGASPALTNSGADVRVEILRDDTNQ